MSSNAGARQAVTARLLQAKHEMIEKVLSAAQKSLGKMPADQYRQLLKDLLKRSVVSGKETVIAAEGEKHLDQGLLDEVVHLTIGVIVVVGVYGVHVQGSVPGIIGK